MTLNIAVVAVTAVLAAAQATYAQETPPAPGTSPSDEKAAAAPARTSKPEEEKAQPATKEEVRALAEEIRRLKLEAGLRDLEYKSYGGLGPAASKVYFAPKGLSIGGYGEVTYRNMVDGATGDQSDLLRAVLYAGYRFNDRIVFNSEIEFEHAGREVSVEFAYLDFLLTRSVQIRAGNVLVPLGFVNELHEPAFFNGVFRPDLERRLIPSTWSENGLGLHGEVGGLRYKAYLLTGLDLFRDTGDEPVEADSWLRETRSGGAESRAATLAGALRLDHDLGPVTVGAAVYRGRADQREQTAAGAAIRADVTLAEVHAQLAWRGLSARVLGVVGTLGDAAAVNERLGLPLDEGLGSRVQGGYAEVGYDVFPVLSPSAEQSLVPFVRYERFDLNARVPSGYTRNPGLDRTVITAGATYRPIPTVVVKGDWQRRDSAGGAAVDQVDLGVGLVF